MSVYEDSYKSQLQGVSEQVARERQPGQVAKQENMLSDAVTNIRRRPGALISYDAGMEGAEDDRILIWDTDLAGRRVQVILNCVDGVVRVREASGSIYALPASTDLITYNITDIQTAVVGDEMFFVNTTKRPKFGTSVSLPASAPTSVGFFYIRAAAFNKKYSITLTYKGPILADEAKNPPRTYSYNTPMGTLAGDAEQSSPEFIANYLCGQINGAADAAGKLKIEAWPSGACVFIRFPGPWVGTELSITTPTGSAYLVTSAQSYLRNEADLPTSMPWQADGMVMRTGDYISPRYFMYDREQVAWLECGAWDAPQSIIQMPVGLKFDGQWLMNYEAFEGCLAGDATTNPAPPFMTKGITGLSTYQGRLVILSGNMVSMSASSKPRRFYRSTITTITDSDAIHIGATAAQSASYKYAVAFGKDLLLFSDKYQAVVPGGQAAITPRNATVVVTSQYESDMTAEPVAVGRTLMYATPRSSVSYGIMEMSPSQYAEAQYTSYDSTPHLPTYMPGRCRFMVSSSMSNMVIFGCTEDRNTVVVHEYAWEGDTKAQQAWHKWSFAWPVAYAYFSGQRVCVAFVQKGKLVVMSIDPKSKESVFLDMYQAGQVDYGTVQIPMWMRSYPDLIRKAKVVVAEGPLRGETIQAVYQQTGDDTLACTSTFPVGKVWIGIPYTSTLMPTAPMVKDRNGVKISSNKVTILRFMIGTNNSMEYQVKVVDQSNRGTGESLATATLDYSSEELALDHARIASDSTAIVPCRTNADTTEVTISTSGSGELNVVGLEFVLRTHQKIKRA
jgi:hypothetical protein